MDDKLGPLADRLRNHVEMLAGKIGERNVFHPSALRRAELYIRHEWEAQGYPVRSYGYQVHELECSNLQAERAGGARADQIILLGAHYDSVIGSPGANDNASGVAALLELSRMFRTVAPECAIRFVAFVNEEPPFFDSGSQGSRIYARLARDRGDQIRAMLSLETIGYYSESPGSQRYPALLGLFYPDTANFIAFVGNLGSRLLTTRLADAFSRSTDFPMERIATLAVIPGVSWSDHSSFWAQGYQAVMVTDTALYRYPFYHTRHDTPEKIRYGELARVTLALFSALRKLDRQ